MPFAEVFDLIAQRFLDIVRDLHLALDLHPHLEEIKRRIASGASADYTASRGEYLNGLILADLLGYDFIDPAQIVFFDAKGSFDRERTQEATSARLAQHHQAVIPGFYGATPEGRVKTFPRGGSDITGAIVARGVQR